MCGELDWIVMKSLEKDRARRYETASGLAADAQRYLNDEAVQAYPPSAWYRWRKLVRRHKVPVLSALVLVLALMGGIIGTTWGMIRATHAQADAVKEAQQKESALTAARQSEHDAQEQLFGAHLSQARAGRYSRQMGQRLDSLEALSKAAGIRRDERLRDEAIAAMALPDVRRHGPSWNAFPLGTKTMAFDGRYQVYARADDQGVISIRTIPDNREIQRIVSRPTKLDVLLLSPDGRFLARLEDRMELRVWRVADGQLVLREEPGHTFGWAFSTDSRYLAVGQEGWVLRFDLTTGQEINRWRLPSKANRLAFHPDNRQLAVGYHQANVASVYDATNGALITNLPVGSVENTVAWHPDGQRLAVAGSGARIQIWDVAAKSKLATLEGHGQIVTVLSFHPDGELLASASHDGVVRVWHPSSGRPLMKLSLPIYLQFSNDGRWFGIERHGEQAYLLEAASCREYRTVVSDLGASEGVGFHYGDISPDGRLLAVGMADGTRLLDLQSGRQLAKLPGYTSFASFDRIGPRWELLTVGTHGLLRWPAQQAGEDGKVLRLGPPRQLSPQFRAVFARGPNGRSLAAVYGNGAPIQIMNLEQDVAGQKLGVHPAGDGPYALSADGRWLASCGWHSKLVRVWDARTGQMEREWEFDQRAKVFFTPDSRVLVISRDDEFSFWDVDTWQPIRRLRRDVADYPASVVFSPDGRLMALEMAPAVMHLKEVATGRTVAKLEDPYGEGTRPINFTPDGTQLVAVANGAGAIHIWDLRAIRVRLKAMGLDWDWPEFPPADPRRNAAPPLKVEVDLGALAQPALPRPSTVHQVIEGEAAAPVRFVTSND